MLRFRMAESDYAVSLKDVICVEELTVIRPLPGSLPTVLGVSWDGERLLPVFDIRPGIPGRFQERVLAIVLQHPGGPIALATDKLRNVGLETSEGGEERDRILLDPSTLILDRPLAADR